MKRIVLFISCLVATANVITAQIIHTIGGTGSGGFSGDSGPATLATIGGPQGVCLDGTGLLYVVDGLNYRVRTINSSGIINTFAGSNDTAHSGDGGPATAAGIKPRDVAADGNGNIYISCQNHNRVRIVNASGTITTFAGNGGSGYSGDGGLATAAQVGNVMGVKADKSGNVYIAHGNVVRRIDAGGIISTIAGTSAPGFSGDGGPATAATFSAVTDMALDDTGNIYVCDYSNNRIRKINRDGIVTTIAGTGAAGYSGDAGPAVAATLKGPIQIALDELNNIYISDGNNHCVRKINIGGIITTIAGNGIAGFSGDGGPATAAQLWNPRGIAIDSAGNVYLGVASNARVRMIKYNNHMPAFAGGHSQVLTVCENDAATSLSTLLTAGDADAGQPLTWVLSVAPAHGTAVVSYSATSAGSSVVPTGVSYTPAAGFWGSDTFTVRIDDGITAYKTTIYVTVNPFHAGPISGLDSVCTGWSATLSGTAAVGVWSSSNPSVATVSSAGVVTAGTSAGTATISYAITNSCGTVTATHPFKVYYTPECATGIGDIQAGSVSVYPNPCTRELRVNCRGIASFVITDVTGRQLVEGVVNDEHAAIPLDGIAPGVLFVAITTAQQRAVFRVVKE